MSDARKGLGALGERLAAEALEQAGLRIVARNWRCEVGEIDIVAQEGEVMAVVEVKTRRGRVAGTPEQAVNDLKQQKLCELAGFYIEATAWAGPVVAAAVLLPPEPERLAIALAGVDDCKRLSPSTRERLAARIWSEAAVGVGVISAVEIDNSGIIPATVAAMEMALAQLQTVPDHLLIDYIPRPLGSWPQTRIKRGESASMSIAAASIIAKTQRDSLMVAYENEWPGYGFARHKGYGTAQHHAAIAALGPCLLHRRTWAPFLQLRLPLDS